ncbi:TPR-like protein [Polyporus arcularius HHB13444]|uniref:TPR-like protein n=1 Tax=Polyporus arcularius HHB13444 TaxID=1314778 RepID=A0A5C3PY72_9APHY|nr:TPR-like protein [Polyporus arcularius HHB13444]
MSLPLLVNGAECGPSNPLQGLSKRFDQDRGIQQDQFSAGRAGSSKEAFRSQYSVAPGVNHDAARFFSSTASPAPALSASAAFDLSVLHRNLPASHSQSPIHAQSPIQSPPLHAGPAAWAADFLQHQPVSSTSTALTGGAQRQTTPMAVEQNMSAPQQVPNTYKPGLSWSPSAGMSAAQFAPMAGVQSGFTQVKPHIDAAIWDQEFRSQELSFNSAASALGLPVEAVTVTEAPSRAQQPHDADELARTAALLIHTVKNEPNPKFKNSAFMGLMRQLRDGEVTVEGNDMVQRSEASGGVQSHADAKGKGRAVDVPPLAVNRMQLPTLQRPVTATPAAATSFATGQTSDEVGETRQEDPNDAYFRQENEDYIKVQQEFGSTRQAPPSQFSPQQAEWDNLQRDWEEFEATTHGLRPLSDYQFQASNPYLNGEASRTRHHTAHADIPETLYESVLEMEAAVQRDPTNAARWYELGVKQQENEREQKAIQALRRALELDPTHLASWLALAISHTNEGNRSGAYSAIREWVERNERYSAAVAQFRALNPEPEDARSSERLQNMMHCLMSIVREHAGGEIDADIQIALAVLLNTNEDYAKARDCFTTALAVRPDDWLLYNRVGATLANSGHPEEALQYYYTALELNPGYIRARFNLGISCTNLRRYDEAAQHILDALILQAGDSVHDTNGKDDNRGVTSHALWDSLKTCCLHMQRLDLATLCDSRDMDAFRLNFQMM